MPRWHQAQLVARTEFKIPATRHRKITNISNNVVLLPISHCGILHVVLKWPYLNWSHEQRKVCSDSILTCLIWASRTVIIDTCMQLHNCSGVLPDWESQFRHLRPSYCYASQRGDYHTHNLCTLVCYKCAELCVHVCICVPVLRQGHSEIRVHLELKGLLLMLLCVLQTWRNKRHWLLQCLTNQFLIKQSAYKLTSYWKDDSAWELTEWKKET